MTQLNCVTCAKPATVSVLADPFGKSDMLRSYCAEHAPLVKIGIVARAQNDTPVAVQRVVMSWFP